MSVSSVVIVGAGQGGYQVAASLRQEGFVGAITLLSDESGLPYQRPPLSKAYLLGKVGVANLLLRQENWYGVQNVNLVHDKATAIDRHNRRVFLASGQELQYEHLVLATGALNRTLPVPGAHLRGVIGIRTLTDADALSPLVHQARNVVVIGAGFIGLEFAAVAAALGASVHVLELADRPMGRAVSLPMSQFFRESHESWGVHFRFGERLAEIEGKDGHACGAITAEGRSLPADLIVYGIGVVPNARLAAESGLAVDNGIQVNAQLLTSDAAISAIGDAVVFPCAQAGGKLVRLESVQNAVDQGRNVAARLMGKPSPYSALPWFWSDQGDLKLQIAGLSEGHDKTVELATSEARQKTVLCFKDETLIAVETANRPGDHMLARRVLARTSSLTPDMAAVPGFDLKTWEHGLG